MVIHARLQTPLLFLAVALLLPMAERGPSAQSVSPREEIAITVGSDRAAARALDARIGQMVQAGELVLRSAVPDALAPDRRHGYFAQVYRGVPVLGGGVSRQVVDDQTVSAFGVLYMAIDLPFEPRLSAGAAIEGLRQVAASPLAPGSDVALVVILGLDGRYRLTYQATLADGRTRFVDADTGAVVQTEDAYSTQGGVGTGQGVHGDRKKVSATQSAGTYEARDPLRPSPIVTRSTQGTTVSFEALLAGAGVVASDTDNVWDNPALVDAHVNAGLTYDYFHQRQDWQGVDGLKGAVVQVVNDRATLESNAFFAYPTSPSNPGLVAYGVTSAGVPVTTLDIVGHELMHGVTFFSVRRRTGQSPSSGLIADGLGPSSAISQGQALACTRAVLQLSDGTRAPFFCVNGQYALASNPSGAINESVSDVFGTAVEFFHQPPGTAALRADYLLGEDTAIGGPGGTHVRGLIRSLADPAAYAVEATGVVRYPDHVDRRLRFPLVVVNNELVLAPFPIVNGQFIFVPTDSGGVHWNATILGYAFYLAIEGGQHRTSGQGVQGVGALNRAQIERVYFRAMTVLMPATATYPILGGALRQSAIDLYGSGSAAYRAIDQSLSASGL
jgi:bacillolysin